ncbi:MAG: DUF4350 domain-containing protein, partial [Proteobacteria bacterium]|nr:DUF4350 domain-containing protein [Pseudomonadota bacterium]
MILKFSSNAGSESLFQNFLFTFAGILLSIVVLLNVLLPQQQYIPISRPTSEDTGKHGLFAIYQWLTSSGVRTLSLRKPVHRIQEYDLPYAGNVMLINLPYANQALESEWAAINQWIEQGNTAVVFVAGLYAKPEWTASGDVFAPIKKLTADEFILSSNNFTVEREVDVDKGSNFELSDLQDQVKLFKPKRLKLSPAIKHSLFENIEALDAYYLPMLMRSHTVDDDH